VIILSGDPDAESQSRREGATSFILKPVDLEELIDTVSSVQSSHG
jgi:FixJ family two-component response regulator